VTDTTPRQVNRERERPRETEREREVQEKEEKRKKKKKTKAIGKIKSATDSSNSETNRQVKDT
jgi:hypothetical protein